MRYLLSVIICCIFSGLRAQEHAADMPSGALVFQDLDCGLLCDAIEAVTPAWKGHHLSANAWGDYNGDIMSRIKKVSKNEIGDLISYDFDVFYPDYYDSPLCIDIHMLTLSHLYDDHFCVGAIEYDWYASAKKIFSITGHTGPYEVKGHRKFYNEWYFFNPDNNTSYSFLNRNPNPNTDYVNTTKGEIHLLRHY